MDDIFKRMEAELAAVPSISISEPESLQVSTTSSGIPLASDISLMTFNYWVNDASHKTTWSSSRHSMSTQIFTIRTPFTPTSSLAAWAGSVQLHDPNFWDQYVHHKHETGKIDDATHERLHGIWRDTHQNYPEGVLLGTFVDKSNGTAYYWDHVMRFWFDQFHEPNLQVMFPGGTFDTFDPWEVVKPRPNKLDPKLRTRYDPEHLWLRKDRSKKGRP